jgi:hypothetical protein
MTHLGLGSSSSRARFADYQVRQSPPNHPEVLATRCLLWRHQRPTRSNALYDRCATEHERSREAQESANPLVRWVVRLMRSVQPRRPVSDQDASEPAEPKSKDQRFCWSEARRWAWEELNLRLHPYQQSHAYRHAILCFCRPYATLEGEVMRCSKGVQ